MKQRLLCLLLCFSMLSTLFTVGAHAAEEGREVRVASRLYEVLFGEKEEKAPKSEDERKVLVGGEVFGIRLTRKHPEISSVEDGSPAHGLLFPGDEIVAVGEIAVATPKEVSDAILSTEGPLTLTVLRRGEETDVTVTRKGTTPLGIEVRGGAAGIGTVTFIDPESGTFGGLGHAVCDPGEHAPVEISDGTVTDVIFGGARRGTPGDPGELSGVLKSEVTGTVTENGECGVTGTLKQIPGGGLLLPVATRDEVHEGDAVVRSTVCRGEPQEYAVRLDEIKSDESGNKCFVVEVTDPALLAITGGIVRGMSGSPVIQDGKLVGALTHVLISDPTVGYGIFIDNMPGYADAA